MIFVDKVQLLVRSGKGGDGCVSFRREKYIPNGGPDGGDGGRGGDIIFRTDSSMNTLFKYRHQKKYLATNGEPGRGKNAHGKDGKDLVLYVPKGTIIRDVETEKVIADMAYDQSEIVLLSGGKGGLGNQHFATPTMQIPKYAQPGQEAKERWVYLELKSIADVGLVGFPNVGKSTLLSRVSNAKPKIANYHFTTLTPNLGVVEQYGDSFVIADIPGLIEGASTGIGLGHEFLKHVERTKVLVHVVDIASVEGRQPLDDLNKIFGELEAYNPQLLKKPQLIAANKLDAAYDKTLLEDVCRTYKAKGIEVYPVSAVSGQGIKELLRAIYQLLQTCPKETTVYPSEFDPNAIKIEHQPVTVYRDDEGVYQVEGERIERMLGYTHLDSAKGFQFFQKFMKDNGVLEELENLGIEEGDIVNIGGLTFEFLK